MTPREQTKSGLGAICLEPQGPLFHRVWTRKRVHTTISVDAIELGDSLVQKLQKLQKVSLKYLSETPRADAAEFDN